jgi:DNA-3-methyladenine glycosylase
MFGPPGIAYVYLVYGMYDCLNIVTEPAGSPAALLVRAVEPLEGIELMRADRLAALRARRRATTLDPAVASRDAARIGGLPPARLASGPGLAAAAFGIAVSWTGTDLCAAGSALRLETRPDAEPAPVVRTTPRIGVGYAGVPWTSRPWRFIVAGHRSVSGPVSLR